MYLVKARLKDKAWNQLTHIYILQQKYIGQQATERLLLTNITFV